MTHWKCPCCKRVRKYDKEVVMKICVVCDCLMEMVEDGE